MPSPSRPSRVGHVHGQLLRYIDEHGLSPGDKLPSEAALSELFSVSRPTLREALKLLDQEGLVTAVTGHGRYLTAARAVRVERPVTRYEGLSEMLGALGYRVSTDVLSVAEAAADEREAAGLGVRAGDPVIRLRRVKSGDGRPMVVSVSALRRDTLPGPLDEREWTGSLVEMLASAGRPIVASAATITASELPDMPELGDRVHLPGGPWLLVRESSVTEAGDRVLYSEDYHRGGDISFQVERRR